MLLFELIIIYILLVFVMTRLVVPHFGFSPSPVSQKIPVELQQKINELKLSAESFGTAQDKEFLKSGLQEAEFSKDKTHYAKSTKSALELANKIAQDNTVVLIENDLPDQYF
jgi:hypothetical protein